VLIAGLVAIGVVACGFDRLMRRAEQPVAPWTGTA
jgi:ABC-type nitrate/sulfonate/bicarbonate transport system permease component